MTTSYELILIIMLCFLPKTSSVRATDSDNLQFEKALGEMEGIIESDIKKGLLILLTCKLEVEL